jgi:hypothetical protein
MSIVNRRGYYRLLPHDKRVNRARREALEWAEASETRTMRIDLLEEICRINALTLEDMDNLKRMLMLKGYGLIPKGLIFKPIKRGI